MRAHVLVADQVVDEFDFLLSVRRQPQVDEGRQDATGGTRDGLTSS